MDYIRNLTIASLCAGVLAAQSPPAASTRATVVITMGHFYGKTAPVVTASDVTVTERFETLPVAGLVPFTGERAGLELYLLVDQCSDCEPGSKMAELREFIRSQPATTAVGVAYIQEGQLRIAQIPTPDRESVIKVLSPPAGSKTANPFGALTDLIRGWKPAAPRRAVVMITTGNDSSRKENESNQAAEAAITAAQRGGVTVFALYHPSADYLQADIERMYAGQVQLAHVARESGGEAYFMTFGPLPSLAPFLNDVADHLANQYLLEFLAKPAEWPGELREISVRAKNADIELMAPDRAWIPSLPGSR